MPDVNVTLNKIQVDYPSEALDFPYTLTLFGTDNDEGTPVLTSATNTGATVDPEEFYADTVTAASWTVTN